MLRKKIVRFTKIYKFTTDNFLIKKIVFVLDMENFIKNKQNYARYEIARPSF